MFQAAPTFHGLRRRRAERLEEIRRLAEGQSFFGSFAMTRGGEARVGESVPTACRECGREILAQTFRAADGGSGARA